MGDNIDLPDRNGVRTPMQWDDSANAGFSTGKPFSELVKGELGYQNVNVASQINDPDSLFRAIKRMIAIRKKYAAFGGSSMEWIETGNPSVAVYVRQHQNETLLIINNLSTTPQTIQVPVEYQAEYNDLLAGDTLALHAQLTIQSCSYQWLELKK